MVLYAILSYSDRYVQRSRRLTASAPTWLRHMGGVRHVVWVWRAGGRQHKRGVGGGWSL
jgi:hypothetical protein